MDDNKTLVMQDIDTIRGCLNRVVLRVDSLYPHGPSLARLKAQLAEEISEGLCVLLREAEAKEMDIDKCHALRRARVKLRELVAAEYLS